MDRRGTHQVRVVKIKFKDILEDCNRERSVVILCSLSIYLADLIGCISSSEPMESRVCSRSENIRT